jgi:uracil-DNA glycosylase family 4
MEDAAAKLTQLAADVTACTRCDDLAGSRRRAVPGAGHPHAHVMVVAPCPSESDEAGTGAAGSSLLTELAALLPGLADSERVDVYLTALVKCVPRDGTAPREPLNAERDTCFSFLSLEISTITPHFLLPVGRETSAFVLQRLFGRAVAGALPPGIRVLESPAFRVVPIAAPAELRDMAEKDRRAYEEQLRALAGRIGI